jgi:methyl-accepting chemotaxis protein
MDMAKTHPLAGVLKHPERWAWSLILVVGALACCLAVPSAHALLVGAMVLGSVGLLAVAGRVWQGMRRVRVLLGLTLLLQVGLLMLVDPGWGVGRLSVFLVFSFLPQLRDWRVPVVGVVALGLETVWLASGAWRPADGVFLAAMATQGLYIALIASLEEGHEAERFELDFLTRAMGLEGPIRLNLSVLRADSALGRRIQQVQARMREALIQMHHTTTDVAHGAHVLNQGSVELNERTHSTASGLRDAALCLEQINVIVQSSARASGEARSMASTASELAGKGGELMTQAVSTMEAIDQSSKKITDIISVIDGIAFQTNILALNAAIEAARAGEQGRGFAVVAAEVRSLALRTTQAAQEVKQLIHQSGQAIEGGRDVIHHAGTTMQDIVLAVRRVGEVFDQLSADSQEHAVSIDVVTQSVKELDAITQQNLLVAERSNHVSAQLQAHANQFGVVLNGFKLGEIPAHTPQVLKMPDAPTPRGGAKPLDGAKPVVAGQDTGAGIEYF